MSSATSEETPQLPTTGKKAGSFGAPWLVVLTTLAVFVLSQVLAGIIAVGLLTAGHKSTNLDTSNAAQFIYILLAEALSIGLVYFVIRRRGLDLKAIGLGRRPAWRDLKHALIGFAAFYAILIIAGIIVSLFVPSINNEQQDVGFNTISTFSDSILAFAALVFLPPLGEETLVRGYLYSGLRARWKFWPALLLTSVLFGAAHLSGSDSGLLWSGALDTFLLSGVLVFLREKTGALYAGMLVHALNNVIAFGVHFH
jgi:membrane protease YdiL (CAAX protease family)